MSSHRPALTVLLLGAALALPAAPGGLGLGLGAAVPTPAPAGFAMPVLDGAADGLRFALALAPEALLTQEEVRRVAAGAATPDPRVASLTDAVASAYAAYGLPALRPDQLVAMRAQEAALPQGLAAPAAALLAALAGHLAVQRAAFAGVTLEELDRLVALTDALTPGDGSPEALRAVAEARAVLQRVDRVAVFASALRIASASDALAEALLQLPEVPANDGPFFYRDPFDLVLIGGPGANAYTGNSGGVPVVMPYANLLTIDLGGDDVYTNNAGGASSAPFAPVCIALGCGNGLAAAAAVDLGGNDDYVAVAGTPWTQGTGGLGGVAVLRDLGGDDLYHNEVRTGGSPAHQFTQGMGVVVGVGLLVDDLGNDVYLQTLSQDEPPNQYGQGVGDLGGVGVLLDRGGNDRYTVELHIFDRGFGSVDGDPAPEAPDSNQWIQGSALFFAVGLLADLGGADTTLSVMDTAALGGMWAQGAGWVYAAGFVLDGGGNDVREALLVRTDNYNPIPDSAWVLGAGEDGDGYLVDLGGDDTYAARMATPVGATQFALGTGGGAVFVPAGSAGVLEDHAGNDLYEVLLVAGGDAVQAAMGVGTPASVGVMVEGAGDDTYLAGWSSPGAVTQALRGAGDLGIGLFVDRAGQDTYGGAPGADGTQWVQGTGVGTDL